MQIGLEEKKSQHLNWGSLLIPSFSTSLDCPAYNPSCRLTFVLIFEVVVAMCNRLIKYIIFRLQ